MCVCMWKKLSRRAGAHDEFDDVVDLEDAAHIGSETGYDLANEALVVLRN